ncbi:hypothetical protein [Bauldia litoralis]|uniref:hypothetical protein n=1 Tax=Bauldia litoralis TaxID=665467 RepID=UPI0032656C00
MPSNQGLIEYLKLILDPNYSGSGFLVNRSTGTQATDPGMGLMESYVSAKGSHPTWGGARNNAERKATRERGAGMMEMFEKMLRG